MGKFGAFWVLVLACFSPAVRGLWAIISPTFGEMRGKLAGNVFSRNKGGPYVRQHAVPTNPNTARQQSTRAWLSQCSSLWNTTLTAAQRAQWNEFAETHSALNSLGQTIFLTGLDWFTKVNTRLLDAGLSTLAAPTDLLVPSPMATVTPTMTDEDTLSLAFTPALPSDHHAVLWGSGPITAGSDPNFRQMRLVGYSPVDQVTPWEADLPWTLGDGQKVKIYAGVMSDEGRVSVMLSGSCVYTAI